MTWAAIAGLIARFGVAAFSWLRVREERKAAQEARVDKIAEAARKTEAIQKTVDGLKEGEAEKVLRTKWGRLSVIVLSAGLSLGACTAPAPVVVDASCAWEKPILVADADHLTDATARDILAHNEAWEARCKK